jgi:hypothetical protein
MGERHGKTGNEDAINIEYEEIQLPHCEKTDKQRLTANLFWLLAIVTAPFFSAVILKVKAFFGGKKGPPLLINY